MEPEDYAELLQLLRNLCARIIPQHGGEIVRVDGDGVLCIFGYPIAYDDAGRRATEAAIDLHEAAATLDESFASADRRIRLHTGIHSGTVLVREGDLVRGRFEMLGDATNVAARLCDFARPGEIIVSEATLGADRLFFTTGPQRAVTLSGRQHALPVYTVFGREAVSTRHAARIRRGVASFAGRVPELALLDQVLAKVSNGRPAVAILAGPAGIGKTRLASEFLDRMTLSSADVHRGYCEAYLGAQPLQPFTQIAQSLNDQNSATDPSLAVLDVLAGELMTLVSHQRGNPLILAIDDWQWADDASRNLFERLVSTARGPVLFLLSTRNDDPALGEFGEATIIPVQPLDSTEADAAIEAMLATPDPLLVERIREQAGGNPLYIEELCHAQTDGNDAAVGGERSSWLDAMIQARFARLPADQATLVGTAAVLGHIFPIWLFEAVSGVDALHPSIRQLGESDFLYAGETAETLRFKHSLTRDAIYRTVGLKRRQDLHRRAAEALEARSETVNAPTQLDALAYHFAACGNAVRAVEYSARAGDAAMAVPALDRAQAHYREALGLLAGLEPSEPRRRLTARLVHKFGLASVVDPSPEQLRVLDDAERLTAATHNIEGLANARYWSGALLYGVGRPRESVAKLEKALADAAQLDRPRLVDQLQANLGQSFLANGQYDEAEVRLNIAIERMRARVPHGIPTGLAYAIGTRALLRADQGRFDHAHRDFALVEDVLGADSPVMFGSILNKRSVCSIWQGRLDDAIALAEAGIVHGTHTRSRYYTMMSRALLAYSSWLLAGQDTQIDQLVKATAWFEAGASQHRTSLCHSWLADMMSRTGDITRTRRYAAAALRRARKGDRLGEALAYRAMARISAPDSGPRAARDYLYRAHAAADARSSARETAETRLCAAEILRGRGDVHAASLLAKQAQTEFAAMAMDHHVTRAAALALPASSR